MLFWIEFWVVETHIAEGCILEVDVSVVIFPDVNLFSTAVGCQTDRCVSTNIACYLDNISCPFVFRIQMHSVACASIGDKFHSCVRVFADSLDKLETLCESLEVRFGSCKFHFSEASGVAVSIVNNLPEAG